LTAWFRVSTHNGRLLDSHPVLPLENCGVAIDGTQTSLSTFADYTLPEISATGASELPLVSRNLNVRNGFHDVLRMTLPSAFLTCWKTHHSQRTTSA